MVLLEKCRNFKNDNCLKNIVITFWGHVPPNAPPHLRVCEQLWLLQDYHLLLAMLTSEVVSGFMMLFLSLVSVFD